MPELDAVAGFVLAGGQSRRMGRDKALLPLAGETLVENIAREVRRACGSVAILGDPARYSHLNLPVVPDIIPGRGPLSGLHAALHSTAASRILLVACDLPNVTVELLNRLIFAHAPARCVAADAGNGLEPLCAVYHRDTLPAVEAALHEDRLRMRDLIAALGAVGVQTARRLVHNVNTEADWKMHLSQKEGLS